MSPILLYPHCICPKYHCICPQVPIHLPQNTTASEKNTTVFTQNTEFLQIRMYLPQDTTYVSSKGDTASEMKFETVSALPIEVCLSAH